jgi:hypothetical protein
VAGYTERFKNPYCFEVGAEIATGRTIQYLDIKRLDAKRLNWFGEDTFFQMALDGIEPQRSVFRAYAAQAIEDDPALANFPISLCEKAQALVGLIKTEAHFNPQKVGNGVLAAIIDRTKKTGYICEF